MASTSEVNTSHYSKISDALGTGGAGDKNWQKAAEGAYKQVRDTSSKNSISLDKMVLPEDRVTPEMV